MSLLGIRIEKKEWFAVACGECGDVKLVDPGKGNFSVAYRCGSHEVTRMCAGGAGKLWIFMKGGIVTELNCSSSTFTPTGRGVDTQMSHCSGLCFLRAPHDALVVSVDGNNLCLKMSCKTGEKLWEVKTVVDREEIQPWGVVYFADPDVLLVADRFKSRILVLDPSNGALMHRFSIPPDLICKLFLDNEHLYVIRIPRPDDFHKISLYKLSSL